MKDQIAWRILRWVYAAFYVFSGVQMALTLMGLMPPPDFKLSPASAEFQGALFKTGFVIPILAAIYVIAGAAMLFYRTAPLGIVLLAPVMVNIFLCNTLLDSSWIWGTAHTAILVALAWHFRSAYRPLWTYAPAAG